jgi:hypothetical protein
VFEYRTLKRELNHGVDKSMPSDQELLKSWKRLVSDPRTPGEQLKNAAYWESINFSKQFMIRILVARHRAADSDLLSKLAMIDHLPLQIAVAGHPNITEATAGKLFALQLRELRRALASNPSIPSFVMNKLARDFTDIRSRLARNPAVTLPIMKKFSRDPDRSVRLGLAQNQKCHLKVLQKLSMDRDVEIRCEVAKNPNVHAGGLLKMAEDPEPRVRDAIYHRSMAEFPNSLGIFKHLAKFRDTPTSAKAQEHADYLDRQTKIKV